MLMECCWWNVVGERVLVNGCRWPLLVEPWDYTAGFSTGEREPTSTDPTGSTEPSTSDPSEYVDCDGFGVKENKRSSKHKLDENNVNTKTRSPPKNQPISVVFNYSKIELSNSMKNLLNRGFNFSILPLKLDKTQVLVDFKRFERSMIWQEYFHGTESDGDSRSKIFKT